MRMYELYHGFRDRDRHVLRVRVFGLIEEETCNHARFENGTLD